jgi:DNA-binding NtrC family response regulator
MARPHRLSELEKEMGESPESFIPRVVNECNGNQAAAAKKLGVAHSTVNLKLREYGYKPVTRWVKEGHKCGGGGAA